jgi:hypothetical protein
LSPVLDNGVRCCGVYHPLARPDPGIRSCGKANAVKLAELSERSEA